MAEVELRKALTLDDTDSITHQRMGTFYGMQDRYLPAEKEFPRAVELNPKKYLVFHDLGTLYRFLGKTEKAVRALQTSMNYPAASYGVSEGRCFAWLSMTDQSHSEAESRRISLQIRSKLQGINP